MSEAAEVYEGPVCYRDGWHWTVVSDAADKARRVELAEVTLKHAKKASDKDQIAAAEELLTEVLAHPHDIPGERLVLEDTEDGFQFRYRLATPADTRSWHDRKHRLFSVIELEDGQPGLTVTPDELADLKKFLAERREGK